MPIKPLKKEVFMSCHSNAGNKVSLDIARYMVNKGDLVENTIAPGLVQYLFHTLLREGKALGLTSPSSREVLLWLKEQEEKIFDYIPSVNSKQEETLKSLEKAKREVLSNILPTGVTFYAWKHIASLTHYRANQMDNPESKVIAIDLDGCIYDFNSAMREWLVGKGWSRDVLPEPPVYSLQESWGIDHKTLAEEMAEALKAGKLFNEGLFLADGLSGARTLGLAGHVLSVISARNLPGVEEEANKGTVQWLRENGLHVDRLLLVSPSIPEAKLGVHFDLLIDDHPSNIKIALEHGRKAILLDRFWNRDSDLPRASYDYIVNNLEEFL